MAKAKTAFICTKCGFSSPRWQGKCPDCGSWNTLLEQAMAPEAEAVKRPLPVSPAKTLLHIDAEDTERVSTGMEELDRVLGGGLVPGSAVLTGGDPGIGKSTLLLQVCEMLSENGLKCLYASGEESARQLKLRARRLNVSGQNIHVIAETGLEAVLAHIDALRPDIAIIDSIQTVYSDKFTSAPGSVSQVRECAGVLVRAAKAEGITLFIVGHVTKEGMLAGPRVLEHMVDTVLYFEGEKSNAFRVLRAVKNRFGSTNEIALFEMGETGMRQVINPSEIFISGRAKDTPGSSVMCSVEGTRPMLVEIQALVAPSAFGNPRRAATGFDYNRIVMLIAVMEKKLGYGFYNQDAYINAAGGLRLTEPAADLGVVTALASAFKGAPVKPDTAVIGEVGLTGEVRPVGYMEKRLAECAKMGYMTVVAPRGSLRGVNKPDGMTVLGVENVGKALEYVLVK